MPGPPQSIRGHRQRLPGRGRRVDYRRALPLSLLVSLGIHAAAMSVVLDVGPFGHGQEGARRPAPRRSGSALRLVTLRADVAPQSGTFHEPIPFEEAARKADEHRHEERRLDTGADPPADPAAALRPRLFDARLWKGPLAEEGSSASAEAAQLATEIEAKGGSARSGPEVWVLGIPLSLCSGSIDPADCGFGVAPWRRDAYRLQQDVLRGLKRQAWRSDLVDRARAIRARMDSLRDSVPPLREGSGR